MEGQRLDEIPVGEIRPNPRQPRKKFDEEAIAQMALSVASFGVVQPVIVRPVGTEYELIAGERRWRAAREAGLERVPALVKDSSETDALEMALIENLHREDLNGIEEANAYQQLLDDFGITHDELSRRLGKSRVAITNTIRLLQLPPAVQKAVVETRISTGHARALLALQEEPEIQEKIASRIEKEGLSVRQVEELTRGALAGKPATKEEKAPPPQDVLDLISRLEEMLETRVKGSVGKRKGKIVIEFRNVADLKRIFGLISGPVQAADGPTLEGDDAAPVVTDE